MDRSALYVGLMSGTSQDGVDAVAAEFVGTGLQIHAVHTRRYPPALRHRLLRLAGTHEKLTLKEFVALDQQVAIEFASAATALLRRARIAPEDVAAIGSHGQTVFHAPTGAVRSSLQLGDPNVIAARTGITTVADFRRKDLALGGQGAPLVPAFHHHVFGAARERRCVLNLGGIANVTLLAPDVHTRGFDTGPGNALLDEWIQLSRGAAYDAGGRWARSGELHEPLLQSLLADPWFRRAPPKSTGRDQFNLAWLRRRYRRVGRLPAADVQRTLVELTARTVADAVRRTAPRTQRVLVCGGGVRNRLLMERLAALLAPRPVESTARHGLDPQHVEAAAFAWLAWRTLKGRPGNLPAVTGARRAAVLGGIYPA